MSYSQRTLFWVFAIPTLEWEARLRERDHFYFDFMARTDHPDINIDYEHVFDAFGMR